MQQRGIGDNSRAMPGNWLAINRDVEKHPVVGFGQPVKPADPKKGSYSRGEAWQSLLFQAQYAPGEVENKGRTVLLDRGQLMAGLQHLATKWNWSVEAVRWFVKKLEQASMAMTAEPVVKESRSSLLTPIHPKQKANPHHNTVRVLTICNYNTYQVALELDNMLNPKPNPKRTPSAPQESNKETKKQGLAPNGASPSDQLALAPQPEARKTLKPTEAAKLAFDRYNDLARRIGLPIANVLTDGRKQKILARIREAGGMAGFDKALANIERSAFLQGRNDNGFRADFDFICQAKSFSRLLDGGYGNGAHAMKGELLVKPPGMPDKVWAEIQAGQAKPC